MCHTPRAEISAFVCSEVRMTPMIGAAYTTRTARMKPWSSNDRLGGRARCSVARTSAIQPLRCPALAEVDDDDDDGQGEQGDADGCTVTHPVLEERLRVHEHRQVVRGVEGAARCQPVDDVESLQRVDDGQ